MRFRPSTRQRRRSRLQTASVPWFAGSRSNRPRRTPTWSRPGGWQATPAAGRSGSSSQAAASRPSFPDRFERIRSRKPSLFDGISGYVADDNSRPRLVIGPFHSEEDARLFAEALSTCGSSRSGG
jgi:hypothetical protein